MTKHFELIAGASLAAMAMGLCPVAAQAQATGKSGSEAPAAAQSGEATSVPDQASSDAAVRDIVVTAQRREQRLQQAPVAVTALSGSRLDQLNISNTQDLMQVVPSLQVSTQTGQDSGGSSTFFLRGMGQQRSGNGSEPAVGIYVDDFYYPSLSGSNFDIVDLAQLEVLRGPQGTLFGRNTIGGAIRYTTQIPELGKFSGHVTGTVGNYDRYDASGSVNIPVSDFAALRVTAGHLQQNGYVRVQSGGPDAGRTRTDLVRLQARIEPTSSIYINLSGQYTRFKLDGFTYNQPGPLTPQPGSGSFTSIYNALIAPRLGLPLYTDAFKSTCFYCQYGTGRPEFSYTTNKNAFATIGWNIGSGLTLKSLTGWQDVDNTAHADLDGTPVNILDSVSQRSHTLAFSQEVQFSGNLLDNRLNFVSGAFYYNQRDPGYSPVRPSLQLGTTAPQASPVSRAVKSYAGYIDASFKLTEQLTLLGGYRYSEDHKSIVAMSEAGAFLASAKKTFDSSTFRAGAQYQWTPDIMTYANVSTGFRAGGFNPYAQALATAGASLQPFNPEKSTSYEVGTRLQFLDRRITINPTAFYTNWSNIQVQTVFINNGGGTLLLQNAGKARSYGFELEWAVQPTDHVRLFGNFAYLNLHYTDVGSATGITLQSDLQRAPPITFSIGGSHTLDLDSGAKIVSTLNYSFQDTQRSTPTDTDALTLPAYGLLNGRLEFTPGGRRFSVAAYVKNILDTHYEVGGVNYYSNVGAAHFDLGTPREFGLTGRVNF